MILHRTNIAIKDAPDSQAPESRIWRKNIDVWQSQPTDIWVNDMSNTASLPRTGHSFDMVVHRILRILGLGRRARGQRATYIQLSNLSDRQLDDIGLTRDMIETVVMQGPDSVRVPRHSGSIRPASNDSARRFA